MEDERWQAVNTYVGRALEQAPTVRASWLRAACAGDGELLAQAETLLRAATFTGGLLSVSSTLDSSDSSERSTAAGTRRRDFLGTIGHYELREWLGAGGMGQVFRARDLALGRDVALKLLPDRFTPDLRVQLMREADASSRLQHPAIATFYDSGEEGGEAFIAMEYVIGHTLRSRLASGPLPFAEALAITRCLLEALEHAHAAGILHRDIKPENVMVISPRAAKLLDFGLAKHLIATAESAPTSLTVLTRSTDVRVAGTVGYMAPEQLLGDPLDARTDVFQVGAVFYEMLAGTPAFPGASPLERMAAIMSRDPDIDTVAWASLPPGCRVVLSRAVARDRSRRYPSAAAFLRDLEDLVDGRIATELPKIVAVLDFELIGDPGSDWLGSGVAETLRAELARIPDLTVVSRENVQNAIRSLKRRSRNPDALSVGLQLSCGWAVSGTIQQCGRQLRITLQLLVIPTQRVAASEIVDGTSDDIFVMQDRLAKVVAVALGASTSASGAPRHASLDVHECLTRARLLLERLDKNALEHARELLERAVNLDGNYAPALSALAGAYGLRSIATTDPEDLSKALHFATRAIELDPRHAEGHMWKAYVLARQSRFAETALASRRASELDPANPLPLYLAGSSLLFVGQRNDALPLIQRAVDLDPRGGMAWLALGTTHLCLDQLKQARYCFLQARETEANSARYPCAGAAAYVAEVYRLEGNVTAARGLALTGVEDVERSDHAYRDSFRAYALMVLGRSAFDQADNVAARAAFQQVLTQARGRPRTRSCGHVVVQALAGLARADDDAGRLDEACTLFDRRDTFNFEPFYGMLDDLTLFDLAHTAHSIGFHDRAQTLLVRAREAGSRRS